MYKFIVKHAEVIKVVCAILQIILASLFVAHWGGLI